MSILNMITKIHKSKDRGDVPSGNPYKHGGHLWCDGVYYQTRDIAAMVLRNEYDKQRLKELSYLLRENEEGIRKEYAEDLFEEFQQIARFKDHITLEDITDILQIETTETTFR